MIYKYGYRLRPPAIETEPRGYVSKKAFSTKENGYHGVVTYDRELRVGEMYAYDLDYLGVVENERVEEE